MLKSNWKLEKGKQESIYMLAWYHQIDFLWKFTEKCFPDFDQSCHTIYLLWYRMHLFFLGHFYHSLQDINCNPDLSIHNTVWLVLNNNQQPTCCQEGTRPCRKVRIPKVSILLCLPQRGKFQFFPSNLW